MVLYLVLVGATFSMFNTVPGGFVPAQDKQYLIGFAQLPDAATLDRTEEVIKRMSDIALKQPGVRERHCLPGPVDQRLHQQSNAGIVFAVAEAVRGAQDAGAFGRGDRHAAEPEVRGIQEAFIAMFPPPPVQGLGTTGGFKLQIEDAHGLGYQALDEATKAFLPRPTQTPELAGTVLQLPGQRAAALCRSRPRQGASSSASR